MHNKWVNISPFCLTFQRCPWPEIKETNGSSILQICFLVNSFCSISVNLSWILLDYKKLMVRGSVCTCVVGGIQTFFFCFLMFVSICYWIGDLLLFCFSSKRVSREAKDFLHESDKILSGFHEMTGEENKNMKKKWEFNFIFTY